MATYVVAARASRTKMDLNSTNNLVDPEWELIDPIPDIHTLFQNFNVKFFNGKLSCVELEWSKRMYQCAGICYSRKSRGFMSCVIRLSEPLLKLRSRKELIETLLHEMIHAFNFIRNIREANGGHGKYFLEKMHEINRLAGTNITVYHTFHDEVQLYKKHWWRCDGVCRNNKPYFGYVKRTSNRAPGPNDFWWNQHKNSCAGTFIKVKEPEKVEKKPKAKESKPKKETALKRKVPASKTPERTQDIRKFFGSPTDIKVEAPSSSNDSGFTLGGSGSGRSRLLDMFEQNQNVSNGRNQETSISQVFKKPKTEIKSENVPRKSIKVEVLHEFDDDDDIILIDDEFDDTFVDDVKIKPKEEKFEDTTCNCPICNEKVDTDKINVHLDECLTMQLLMEAS